MSGRLGVLGALNRPRTLNALHQRSFDERSDIEYATNSASFSKLERELKSLKAENSKLKCELNETRLTLKQLITESSHEKFDERRINLLKLQLIQLERQTAILNEALGCRQEAVLEVENAMVWLADKLRSFIAIDVKGPMVPVARGDLTSMIEVSESARIKLFKAVEDFGKDAVGKDLLFLNPFIGGKSTLSEPLSILDISLQRMDYVNLRHVAQLESKLCLLYKELIRVYDHMQNVKPQSVLVGHTNNAEKDRMETVILKASVMLKDVADDLMALSLLCPSSPWPVLKRPIIKEVPVERVIAALPSLPRGKQEEVTHVIEASLQTCNHHQFLLTKKIAVLKEELAFHRSVYDFQMQYTQALFDAVRKGYGEFESSARSVICKPLKEILDSYKNLKNSASENAFRDFLIIFKANEEQLTSVVDTFSSQHFDSDEDGSLAFSKFGEEFMGKINHLVRKCQSERDAAITAHKSVKEEQMKLDLELQNLIEELENKYEKMWTLEGSQAPLNYESKQRVKCNSSGQKGKKHKNVSYEDLNQDSSHLFEDHSSKYKGTISQPKQHKNELTKLQSFSSKSDGEECKIKLQNENFDVIKTTGVCDCSLLGQDVAKLGIFEHSMATIPRWKPNKEWDNEFSGLPNKIPEVLPSSTEGDSCKKTVSYKKECSRSGLQIEKSISTFQKQPVKSRENEDSIKKPLSYEPNLSVANRTLKVKHSCSNTNSIESTDNSSLAGNDKVDSFHNLPAHSEKQLQDSDRNKGELAEYGKKKLWR